MTNFSVNPISINNYEKYFKRVDHIGPRGRSGRDDGSLTTEEINLELNRLNKKRNLNRFETQEKRALESLLDPNDKNRFAAGADTDNSGALSKGEALQFISEKNGGPDLPNGRFDEILDGFNQIDKNRNGKITKKEFRKFNFNKADTNKDRKISKEELKALDPNADFSKLDKNRNGELDRSEFNKYTDKKFEDIAKLDGKKGISIGDWIAQLLKERLSNPTSTSSSPR